MGSMSKPTKLVEQINFTKLRHDLKELLEEVDLRLESEFDSFSPATWSHLQRSVDVTILRIRAVRMVRNGATTAERGPQAGFEKAVCGCTAGV
jgi:hypothetical protein